VLRNSDAFSGFSVDDLARAKQFYGEVLGLEVNEVIGIGPAMPGIRRFSGKTSATIDESNGSSTSKACQVRSASPGSPVTLVSNSVSVWP